MLSLLVGMETDTATMENNVNSSEPLIFKLLLIVYFLILLFSQYHVSPHTLFHLYPPPPLHNHRTIVSVHEFFIFFLKYPTQQQESEFTEFSEIGSTIQMPKIKLYSTSIITPILNQDN